MKVYKPGTDCEANFRIFANGHACDEYVLPGSIDESTASVCFVPVSDDSAITIQGTFSGSVLYGRVDVLADGAFVADRIIEDYGSKEGRLKYWDNRKVEVKTFLQVPDLSDHKYRCRPKVAEGTLVAKRLSDTELAEPLHGGDEATGIGIGSITLILSLNQEVFDTYEAEPGEPAYPSVSLGSWRGITGDVADSGIQPEHELRMDVFPDANPVKDKKATLFWRDLKAARPGSEPWASLIFYYRSQAAIDAAGCVPLMDDKILPADGGLWTKASDQALFMSPEVTSTSHIPGSQAGSRVESPSTQKSASPPSLPPSIPTQSPEPKKRLGLGQSLLLKSNQHDADSVPEITTSAHLREKRSILDTTRLPSSESATTRKSNHYAPFENASPTPPRLNHNDRPHSSQHSRPRVSFSDPLTVDAAGNRGAAGNLVASSLDEYYVDDLVLPSLPAITSQHATTRPEPRTSRRSPCIPPKHVEPPSNKRPASQSNMSASADIFASVPPSAKRPRSEEMREKKLRLERALQEKRERKAAMQKKLDDEIMERERQQKLWAEEDAKKREDEERRRAEREEEARQAEEAAFEAEMDALERENEMEDQDLVRMAEQGEVESRKWKEALRARECEADY